MLGSVCLPLDADDTLPEDAVRRVRAAFQEHPDADFVFGNYLKHDLDTGAVEEVDCAGLARGGVLAPETLATGEWILYGGSPCRKELWRRAGGYRAEHTNDVQDVDFWMRALLEGARGYFVAAPIYEWHRSSAGMNACVSDVARVCMQVQNIAF